MNKITKIVKETFGDYVGHAVEAGAFDGVFQSPTYELEKLGWKVLLVEPLPDAFEKLIQNRNPEYCLNFALGSSNKDNISFEVYENYGGASISSLRPDLQILEHFNPKFSETIYVKVRTLDRLLRKVNFPKLDILVLDVEGSELDVLKGFSLEYWKPTLVIIENIFNDKRISDALINYTLVDVDVYNHIYIRNKDV